jgi:hypothetical protein
METTRCKYCGKDGLKWCNVNGKWRLYESEGVERDNYISEDGKKMYIALPKNVDLSTIIGAVIDAQSQHGYKFYFSNGVAFCDLHVRVYLQKHNVILLVYNKSGFKDCKSYVEYKVVHTCSEYKNQVEKKAQDKIKKKVKKMVEKEKSLFDYESDIGVREIEF